MSNIVFLLIFNMGLNSSLRAQCPPADVYLTTQAEVNDFVANYPNCTTINGILDIGSNLWGFDSDVNDISGLNSLQQVDWLNILATDLTSLEGLNNITTVTNNLTINDNALLEDIYALNSLQTVGSIDISHSPELQSVNIFNSLQNYSGNITIYNCDKLLYLDGFQNFTSLNILLIDDNNSLIDISSLSNLQTITDRFSLSDNAVLSDLTGFAVESIQSYFYFRNNTSLEDCSLVCQLLQSGGIGGGSFIENNGVGCSSEQEII